jgi:CopG family transcriptional regulator, nickel-responsive regulator
MQRITITVEDELLERLDALVSERGYQNRSEALRDLARHGMRVLAEDGAGSGHCVGALAYVFNHTERELSRRIPAMYHDHHDLSLASLRVHLDHDSCMEVAVLRGQNHEVQHLADHLIAERGVRYGRLMKIPVAVESSVHVHGEHRKPHRHLHTHVLKL